MECAGNNDCTRATPVPLGAIPSQTRVTANCKASLDTCTPSDGRISDTSGAERGRGLVGTCTPRGGSSIHAEACGGGGLSRTGFVVHEASQGQDL